MFFTRKIPAVDILRNLTDCHTHILPCVDDGVQTTEEALQILSFYEQQGLRKVIFTPHIMERFPRNNAQFLRAEFSKFQSLYSGKVELSLAAEYMLDSDFRRHLKSGELLCLFDNYVLVEMSYAVATVNYISIISEIMSSGYFTVLAHPERYLYLKSEEYEELKRMGVLFQLNLPSLLGAYGKGVQERAKWLLEGQHYDFVATDVHRLKYLHNALTGKRLSKSHVELIKKTNSHFL